MHRRHQVDLQLDLHQSDTSSPEDFMGDTLLPEDSDDDDDDLAPLEPPPPYEQLMASSSPSNPYLNQTSLSSRHRPSRQSPTGLERSEQVFQPRMAPRQAPSAPPLTLLTTTSSSSSRADSRQRRRRAEDPDHVQYDDSSSHSSRSSTLREARKGKQPQRRRAQQGIEAAEEEGLVFGAQPAMSPSYLHPSATSSSSSLPPLQQGYFYQAAAVKPMRRLEHKQAYAQHQASAPLLHSPLSPHSVHSPMIPLSQSVIPAPPPRLLQFRSREPSAVPACPYLLCQKPIALTRTRRERGVTVWIVCGLLFLCNTYWTTQVLISHFSTPNRERLSTDDPYGHAASSGITARGEASHLVKGFLGFKTHRYKDTNFRNYQRHQSALQRPTIATIGIVQDEQSMARAILSFGLLALMAIIRWWLCLSPLLIRPLFDTVHSCPHPHPYPYPEELEQEEQENSVQEANSTESIDSLYGGDEKKRLKAKDEAERKLKEPSAPPAPSDALTPTVETHSADSSPREMVEKTAEAQSVARESGSSTGQDGAVATAQEQTNTLTQDESTPPPKSRFKFFQRLGAMRRRRREESEAAKKLKLESTLASPAIPAIKQKKLSWKARRALYRAQQKRLQVIKASQDIGRYSLLFQWGSFFRMNRWKQAVLAPGKVQPEAYEQ